MPVHPIRQWRRNLLPLFMILGALGCLAHFYPKIEKRTDFQEFYAASRLVLDGHGDSLYDAGVQDLYQKRFSGHTGTYYNHPPFEIWIYIPFCLLSQPWAWKLWAACNGIFIVWTARTLARSAGLPWSWRIWCAVFLGFTPVLVNFMQGQDAVLLLLLLALSFAKLRAGRNFSAGCLLACGLFKFHLVLPLAVAVALRRRNFALGFALIATLLLLVSAMTTGLHELRTYPHFLLTLTRGVHPYAMSNLRGLAGWLFFSPGMRLMFAGLGSALLYGVSCWLWLRTDAVASGLGSSQGAEKRALADLSFAVLVLSGLLIGYQLSPHDLSLLLLPLALVLSHVLKSRPSISLRHWVLLSVLSLAYLPPLHMFLLEKSAYSLMAIAILLLLAFTWLEALRFARAAVIGG